MGLQKLLKAEANRRVRMCNLQSAKDCASVKTSLATVHARAQEMGKQRESGNAYIGPRSRARTNSENDYTRHSFSLTDVDDAGKYFGGENLW
jgi:hypothetical protein